MILRLFLIAFSITGCGKSYPVICMEDAIVCSLVAHREKVPYRLAVEPGKHVQAQWLIGGEWVSVHERDDMIRESRVDNFKPDKFFYDVRDYVVSRYRNK